MRILLAALIGVLVVCGGVIVSLQGELREERQKNAELQTQAGEGFVTTVHPKRPLLPATGLPPADEGVMSPVASTGSVPADGSAPRSVSAAGSPIARALLRAWQDPEYRAAVQVSRRLQVMEVYPDVVEELGLNRDEARRFINLLAEQPRSDARPPDAAVASQLGTAKLAQWEEYQQNLEFRAAATTMGKQLALAGQPWSSTQRKATTAAILAEQKLLMREQEMLLHRYQSATPQDRSRIDEELDSLNDNATRRGIEAAAPYLSAEQLAILREQNDAERVQSRVLGRLEQEELKAQGATR